MKSVILCALMLLACQKTNDVRIDTWVVQEGHDRSTLKGATFCNPADYDNIDTIQLKYYTTYDSTKFGYHVGSIYFAPDCCTPTNVPDTFNRKYAQLLYKIK